MAAIKVILVALFLGVAAADVLRFSQEEEDFYELMNLLSKPRKLERYTGGKLKAFSFKDCSTASTKRLKIDVVSVAPDPIKLPGTLTVGFQGEITGNGAVAQPIKAVLKVEKKVFGVFIPIPCVDNIGSCTYDDICDMISQLIPPGTQCPTGLPSCRCPFKVGKYSVSNMSVDANVNLPPALEAGDYRIQATLSRMNNELGCLQLELSLA